MNQNNKYTLCFCILFSLTTKAQTFQSETNKSDINEAKKEVVAELKPAVAVYPQKNMLPLSLLNLGTGKYFSKYALLMDKKARTLTVWTTTIDGTPELVEAFPIDMGRASGDKQVLGDLKTPEGIYFFQTIYNKNQLNFNEYGQRAFTMNYPNLFDKRKKKTGSGIWLHAIPPTKNLYRGSRGCVVVRNDVITKFNDYISLKNTPFVIEESVDYVDKEPYSKKQKELNQWLSTWVSSWKNKNLETYMDFYSNEFYSNKMTKKRWRNYKGRLNKKYSSIDVKFNEPVMYKQNGKMIIKFIQSYKSDTISDSGEKILHVVSNGDSWEIISEAWKPLKKDFLSNYQIENSEVKNN